MPVKKVYSLPTPTQARKDDSNAIHQIVLRLEKQLPMVGWEITENEHEADLIAGHAGQTSGIRHVDVAHCHGLYPTAINPEPGWHWAANEQVIANLRAAREITVPSRWVADIIRRDMLREPHIVHWAIPNHWKRQKKHRGYVLWNKTRADGVCDPTPLLELAKRNPSQQFITTFGEGGDNVATIGRQPYDNMKVIIEDACIYLATTKETFGIGTLEAMACGIPILGYRWGGTADIVEHGVSGYLVEPGDIDGLHKGLEYCLENRAILGYNARKVAVEYRWETVAEQFAHVYELALRPARTYAKKISVVIPCHNYQQYVGNALYSVLDQEFDDYEVIVLFDRCTDDSEGEAQRALQQFMSTGKTPPDLRTEHTDYGGPARTRNHGIRMAEGQYMVCLDADDKLGHPEFLKTLCHFLDTNPDHAIAFTGLLTIGADDKVLRDSTWPRGYDFNQQMRGQNQVPTCCMFRKEAWERTGGYRDYVEPAEDAELWLRMGMLGYKAAQVTESPWFHYRMHDESLSHEVRMQRAYQPDWRYFHPWSKEQKPPFAADGTPPKKSWPVRNYDRPVVSVIIPVGQAHVNLLRDALDSVWGQTERNWECIVVNDSSEELDLTNYPWVKLVDVPPGGGAGKARNRGVDHATAPLIAFLDADDMWYCDFLEQTLKAYRRTGRYVYTDWASLAKSQAVEKHQTPDFEPGDIFKRTSTHSIAVLMEKGWHYEIGGFDEEMVAWEDTDYFMKLQVAGICAVRVPKPLLFYRYTTGVRRELGETIKTDLLALLRSRYSQYMDGEEMCGCRENQRRARDVDIQRLDGEMVRIEYAGPVANHNVVGVATKTNYRRHRAGDVFMVWADDVKAAPDVFIPILDPLETIPETETPPPPQKRKVVV